MSVLVVKLPNSNKRNGINAEDGQESDRSKRVGLLRNVVPAIDESIGNHVKNEESANGDKIKKYCEVGEE